MKATPSFSKASAKDGILGQEAIARMHGFRTGLADRLHHLVDDDIGLVGRWRADMDGLVRHFHVQRLRIRVRIDGNRRDAHFPRCLDHAAGNFAPVRDEDFLEHD